ncbi:MAG: zinc ABC transporter permease [Candidatus Improbicoccus devescovinae]|nr:MAG: zinc ABC transporter permease [Candidatus Improbicoccus devescovinae]
MPFSWISYNFMKNSFLTILLITPIFGLLGTMIVNNKMAFFSDALGHCALTGVAIGTILGIQNSFVSLLVFGIIFAFMISSIVELNISSPDTIIGVFASTGLAVGLILLSINKKFSTYTNLLLGDILCVTSTEIRILFIVFCLFITVWILFFNKFMISSLDPDLAISKNINFKLYKNMFVIFIALIVTVTVRWIGVLMVNSLLTIPAAASKNISNNIKNFHKFSVIFSLFSGVAGLIISYYLGISTCATIIIIAALIFFVTLIVKYYY